MLLEVIKEALPLIPLFLVYPGIFPGVLWVGIGGASQSRDELNLLQTRVRHMVEDLGFRQLGHSYPTCCT